MLSVSVFVCSHLWLKWLWKNTFWDKTFLLFCMSSVSIWSNNMKTWKIELLCLLNSLYNQIYFHANQISSHLFTNQLNIRLEVRTVLLLNFTLCGTAVPARNYRTFSLSTDNIQCHPMVTLRSWITYSHAMQLLDTRNLIRRFSSLISIKCLFLWHSHVRHFIYWIPI